MTGSGQAGGAGGAPEVGARRWPPLGDLLPWAAVAPAVGWWIANVGLLVLGWANTDRFGIAAWKFAFYRVPVFVPPVLGALAAPVVVLALLVAGGDLALHGRPAVRRAALVAGAATVVGVLFGLAVLAAFPVARDLDV